VTDGGQPLGWECVREIKDGEVHASSFRSLNVDGSVRSAWHSWYWGRSAGDATIRLDEVSVPELESQLMISVDIARKLSKHIVGIEIGAEGMPETGRPFPGQEPHQPYYGVRVKIESVLTLAVEGHAPVVIGYDRAGHVLFRLPVDGDAVRRGREAMRQAMDATAEMARNFATACQRERRSQDAIIIT
jgi:hypothetical protein